MYVIKTDLTENSVSRNHSFYYPSFYHSGLPIIQKDHILKINKEDINSNFLDPPICIINLEIQVQHKMTGKEISNKSLFHILKAIFLLGIFTLPVLYWDVYFQNLVQSYSSEKTAVIVFKLFSTVSWLLAAGLTNLILHIFFWEAIVSPKLEGKIPQLLKNVLTFIVYFLAVIAIINLVYMLPVSGIWATSGVIGLVIGFGLRSTLTDIFSGIAINIDQPYKVDDWIRVQARGIEVFTGRVIEITWRSTRILKTENVVVVLPNSFLNSVVLTNLSKPQKITRFDLQFTLDFEISPDRILRILEAAVKSADAPLEEPKSKIKIDRVTQAGVIYRVYYWINTANGSPSSARHSVSKSILLHLHQAGLSLAREKQDIYYDKMPARSLDVSSDFIEIFKRIEIFHGFDESEILQLSGKLTRIKLKAGITVVEIHEPGESMFIILEGLLAVYTKSEESQDLNKIDQLIPGEFFGEMSLLTGEPRSATIICVTDSVIFEIRKEDITQILHNRPEMAEQITRVIARRRTTIDEANKNITREQAQEKRKNIADQILHKMAHFFEFRHKNNFE